MRWLLLLLLLLPVGEIYVLARVAGEIGVLNTLALLLASAVLGSWFAKREGVRVLREWQSAGREGRVPEAGVLDGLLVLAGGLLMIAPGFISDVFGVLLLLPPTRRVAVGLLRRWFERKIASGSIHVSSSFRSGPTRPEGENGVVQGRVVGGDEPPSNPQLRS